VGGYGAALAALAAVAALCTGCATSSETADSARRRDLVMVPRDATPVERVAWRDVRHVQPLNRRMILMSGDRPYLLVLSVACQGLRPDSLVISDTRGTFTPRIDNLMVADPFSDLGARAGVGAVGGVGAFVDPTLRASMMAGASVCRPDTLYAIRDEDVAWLRESLQR
jgi:hypothetical protein